MNLVRASVLPPLCRADADTQEPTETQRHRDARWAELHRGAEGSWGHLEGRKRLLELGLAPSHEAKVTRLKESHDRRPENATVFRETYN